MPNIETSRIRTDSIEFRRRLAIHLNLENVTVETENDDEIHGGPSGGVNNINHESDLIVTPDGVREAEFITNHGQVLFTLRSVPSSEYELLLYYNGAVYRDDVLSITGNVVKWDGDFSFDQDEMIKIRYYVELP